VLWAACLSEKLTEVRIMQACQVFAYWLHIIYYTLRRLDLVVHYASCEQHLQLVAAWFQWLVQLPASVTSTRTPKMWLIEHLFMSLKLNTAAGRDTTTK
jgi:hypothetical protein